MELSEFTDIIQQHQGKSDKDTVGLRLSIGERHTALLNRLASSPHAYHNLSHAIDIHKRLWLIYHGMLRASLREYGIRYRKMILIGETGLRHDDSHSGNTYRQDIVIGGELSNEEFAGVQLERDLVDASDILRGEISMMVRLIHISSFGQRTLERDDPRYRDYTAQSLEEDMFVFADIGGVAIQGWEYFLTESINLLSETGIYPDDIATWIRGRQYFIEQVVLPAFMKIRPHLKQKESIMWENNIKTAKKNLDELLSDTGDEACKEIMERIYR